MTTTRGQTTCHGTDLERQLGRPVVANAHRDQARGDEIARIHTSRDQDSGKYQPHNGKEARGREDQSGSRGIVAKKRLQQRGQRGGVRVEDPKRAENNDARPAKILVGQRSKIDKRIRNPQFAPDERDQPAQEQNEQRCTR